MIDQIAKLPRVSLGCFPTPLVDAKHLSQVLGGPRILIKRDDLSGLALGGNKCRMLEFLMGYVKQQGFDSYVISGVSNLSIQLASAAARLGIKVRQILLKDATTPKEKQGNYVLHKVLNSDMRIREPTGRPAEILDDIIGQRNSALESEVLKLRDEGYNPFVVRALESLPPVAGTGWVNGVDEIWQQLKEQNIEPQYLVVTTGVGITHSALVVGAKYLRTPFKIIGISNLYERTKAISEVVRMSNETAEFLELDISIMPEEIIIYDQYRGGYGTISKESIEAVKLVAQTEGFFLDPIYTGKAMAGLIDLIHKGQFTSKETIVFIHTGGIPSLFVHSEEFVS